MIYPVITQKPKFMPYKQRSPTLGFELNTPVHYGMKVFIPKKQEIINMPICGMSGVYPLLLTDDIRKCTCHNCIIKVMHQMIGLKQKGGSEDEEEYDTEFNEMEEE